MVGGGPTDDDSIDPAEYKCSPVYTVTNLPYKSRYREEFNTYNERLYSFPLNQAWPVRLRVAESGFYSDELDPRVIVCFFCGLRVLHTSFSSATELKIEHIRWSPRCIFARLDLGLERVLKIVDAHHKATTRLRIHVKEFVDTCKATRQPEVGENKKLASSILEYNIENLAHIIHGHRFHKKMEGAPMKMEYILNSLKNAYPIKTSKFNQKDDAAPFFEVRRNTTPVCGECGAIKRSIKLHPCSTTLECMQCSPFPMDYCAPCGKRIDSVVCV